MSTENLKVNGCVLIIAILLCIGFGCAPGQSLRRVISNTVHGEDLFTTAEWFYEKGRLDRAETFYERYLFAEPDSLQADNALFRLGEIAMTRGDYIKSLELFQELPDRYPGSELIPSARFQAARSLYLNFSWDRALHNLRRFQEDFPVSQYNPQVMLILADIYIKTREYAKAKEEVMRFLRLFPETNLKYSALYHFGLSEMYLGETEEAINHLTVSLTGELPNDQRQDALYALGTLSLMKGDLLTAVEYFSDLIKSIETGERKDRILKKVKSFIQERLSDEELNAIIQHHPTDFPGDLALIELAERKFNQGELSDARYYLEMLLSSFPEHPETPYIKQKFSLFEEEKYDKKTTIGKFGCIAPLTGPLSGYGEKMIKGVKMAIEDYNQRYGTSIKVVLFDSMARAENTQKGVELLAYEDKVAAIIGPLLTSTAITAASKAEQIGIPLFTPTATGEGLPETGRFIFRNCLTNRHQAEALANYAVEELGLTRFGILFPFNAYGQEMMSIFSDKVDALGANVEIIEFYDQDDTDFKDQLVRIHQIRPEALFLPGSYEKIVLIAPQIPFYEPEEPDPNDPNFIGSDITSVSKNEELNEALPEIINDSDENEEKKDDEKEKILLLGTDGWYDQRLIKEGESYIEGAVLSVGFYPESRDSVVRKFVSDFQKRYGEPPDLVSAQAYDATNMLLEASNGGETSWDKTRKNLSQIKDFPGVSGRTTMLPSGDSFKEVSLLQIKRRRFVPLDRSLFNLNYKTDLWY